MYGGPGKSGKKTGITAGTPNLKKLNVYFPDGLLPDPDNPTTPEQKRFLESLSPQDMKKYRKIYASYEKIKKAEMNFRKAKEEFSRKSDEEESKILKEYGTEGNYDIRDEDIH